MSTSNAISSLQQALNCAGKCDCCDKLQQQINAINAQINAINSKLGNIKPVDENALKTSIKSSLEPGIASAIAGGVVVAVSKLQPQIDEVKKTATQTLIEIAENTKRQRLLEIEAKGALETATRAEKNAAEYARQMRLREQEITRLAGEQARLNRVNKDIEVTELELRNLAAKNAREAERLQQIERKNAGKALATDEAIRSAQREAELAKGLANQARNEAATAVNRAVATAADAAASSKTALNAASDVTGLKALINNLGGKVNALGESIAKLETAVGKAITSAANAVGISSEALAATGRLAGKVVEIFNIIGTFAVLFEQVATLNVLGGRIDAVESGVLALGADVSRILGKLLGLQNRIGGVEAELPKVKALAEEAKGIGVAASLKAGAAQVTATRAENFAQIANSNARTAQTTADGAVRNAKIANDNAVIAYSKANEATGNANKAIQDANNATKKANEATNKAGEALGKVGQAIGLGLTALTLYQGVKALRGLRGLPGDRGLRGLPGANGITTVVQLPGTPGRDGLPGRPGSNGINGRNGRNGVDVNPADLASLRALIISQHAATRTNINTASAGLVGGVKAFFTTQLAGITTLITAIATNTYVEKALAVLTFAATIHNAVMLSNNLAQTLGTIIDQVLGFILPKGLDGTPISIGNVLGKVAHEIIADTVGEANYKQMSEDWAKANRIYQAGVNVFNQIGNAVGLVTAGMEVIGGNVAKIGNALKVWGVIGEKAYSWMNPQPNLKGKFFNFVNTATEKANTIAMMVAIPIGISAAALEINNSIGAVKKELDQEDPKDKEGHPITDKLGNPLKWEPGVTVPDPTKTVLAQEQAKADSKNIIAATLEDIFDGGD